MQLFLASLVLVTTLFMHYGYYWLTGNQTRIFTAFSGIQELSLCLLVVYMLLRRVHDWRAAVIIIVAMVYSFVENSMIAVCGWWYAFSYTGPPVRLDRCELMLGVQISKPIIFAMTTLFAGFILPRVWGRRWGTLR